MPLLLLFPLPLLLLGVCCCWAPCSWVLAAAATPAVLTWLQDSRLGVASSAGRLELL
jgi:hypothetical protein